MATKAFQKIYTKITQITKATCSLKATGVGYDELASVDGKLAQVVKIIGDEVTLQVFSSTLMASLSMAARSPRDVRSRSVVRP